MPAEILHTLAAVGGGVLAIAGTLFVGLVLHEAAHALVAAATGCRILEIEIGAGPALLGVGNGRTRLTLRRWPLHGCVRFVHPARRWMRVRHAAVCLAGPVASVGLVALLASAVGSVPEGGMAVADGTWWGPGLGAAVLVAGSLTLNSLLPMSVKLHGVVHWSDSLQVLHMLFRTDEVRDAWYAGQRRTLEHHECEAMFLRGDVQAALERARSLAERDTWNWGPKLLESLAVMVTSGADAALAVHEEAERRYADWRSTQRSDPATEAALRINRACFLAHTGRREDLEAAKALILEGVAEGGLAACHRTQGLVFLLQGAVDTGMAHLRRAWRMAEPLWLRSLCAAWIAYGHALQGDGRRARRWLRRARRLHRTNPLLAGCEELVGEALERAGGADRAA